MNTKLISSLIILVLVGIFFYSLKVFVNNKVTDGYKTIYTKENSSCISCHGSMQGFSKYHDPKSMSCIACHKGNNTSKDKEIAHKGMFTVPGNLSNANETCGKCHPGIDHRVKNSIMNTMSGVVSIDKYVFQENTNLDSLFDINHLGNKTAAESHLRNKCASCHLGNEKSHPKPISEKSRGGGCTACHLNYTEKGIVNHNIYIKSHKEEKLNHHPSLSLKVTDNHCFGCHSRSGRISTNYEGWHETQLHYNSITKTSQYRILEDKRVFIKKKEDIHHTYGMSCIDCHDANDTMGTGEKVAHKEEALHISCEDCHSKQTQIISYHDLSFEDKIIIRLKNIDSTNAFVYTQKSEKALINVFLKNKQKILKTKFSNKELPIKELTEACTQSVHANISCVACHTEWSPQCISCHTSFNPDVAGFDLLSKKSTKGKWVEKGSHYLADFPSLGITTKNGKKKIGLFTPGMVMTLQEKEGTKESFHRLFAPTSPHTISKEGKTCKECHNNSVALGYGRGDMILNEEGQWIFKPDFAIATDGLPEDAWIGYLSNDTINKATRNNTRPFNIIEQKKILRVGACLTCHSDNSMVTKQIIKNFDKALTRKKKVCIDPFK